MDTLKENTVVCDVVALLVSTFITLLGMLFNAILLVIIVKKTSQPLRSYSVLLFNFALVDFFASFGSLMTMQRLLFSGWAITYIFNGLCRFTTPYICYFFHCFNCHLFAHSQWILLVSFIYRYWILKQYTPRRRCVISLSLAIYTVSIIVLASYTVRNSPNEVIRRIMQSYYPQYNLSTVVVGGNETVLEWSATVAVLYMCVSCPFVYTIILFYRKMTLVYLDKATCTLSSSSKASHRNLIKESSGSTFQVFLSFQSLTVQACIPVFYLFGATQYVLGTFHIIAGPIFEHGTFMSMEMMPMLTPLISLFFIVPYREALIQMIGKRRLLERPCGSSLEFTTRVSVSVQGGWVQQLQT